MPTIEPRASSAMTPHRVTHVRFDVEEEAMMRGSWGGQRMFHSVSPIAARSKGADSPYSDNLFPWSSGAWTLRPRQWDTGTFAESSSGALILPGSGLTTVTGVTHPFKTAGDFDSFFRKSGSGAGWASLSAPAKVTSLSAALSSEAALLPIAKSAAPLAINQGICLRFNVAGVSISNSGWIGAMIFGQYALGFRGNGIAEIWEYGTPPGGSAVWRRHDGFRYSPSSKVNESTHHILIYPHIGVTGEKYIAFASVSLDSSEQSSAGMGSTVSASETTGGTDKLFRWDERTDLPDQSGGATNVTTSDQLWLLERPGLRCHWQPSRLVFETTGTLISEFWASSIGDTRSVDLRYIRSLFTGCTVTPTFMNPSGVATTTPGDYFYVRWNFAGTGTQTPILWGYKVQREPVFDSTTPTSFSPPSTNFSIQSGGNDPRSEQASLICEDKLDQYPRLRLRSEFSMEIVVTDSSGETPVDVKLFQGYAISPMRTKLGKAKKRPGMSGMYGTATNHTAEWSQYQVTAAGMWRRLTETTTRAALSLEDFGYDGTATTLLPWKITDAVKRLLTAGGFPSSMQRIPDLPMRLYPGIGTQDSDRILEPSTSIAETIIRMCRNYLGRFLVFDANSGTNGQWTLVGVPASTTPLANFVGGPEWSPGEPLLNGACLAAYPAGSLPTFGRRESYYIPPENNHVWAFTLADMSNTGGYRVDNHLYNHLSFKVPGSSVVPNPNSPHYIGRERLVILADPTLWAGAAVGGWEATQKAVDFVLHRVFAYTCMARQVVKFQAPLIFVTDPATSRKRPLRFYDVVTLDTETGWYVRSCEPNYQHDRQQLANYVLERLIPYQP
jgi:hypothetical protein